MQENATEKTELPTPKRLREARERGQVVRSSEVTSVLLLAVIALVAGWLMMRLGVDFRDLLKAMSVVEVETFPTALRQIGLKALRILLWHTLILAGITLLVGIVANVSQVGFLFTFAPLKPSFERISPLQGWRRICSWHNLFELFKNILKTGFLGYLVYLLVVTILPSLPMICYGTIYDILPVIRILFKQLLVYTLLGSVLIAIADWFFQRHHYFHQLMMSKEEVKREYKEMEVSPEVRRARSEMAREIMNLPMLREGVRRATVIVTNPTHLAVGIRYVKSETPLPQLTILGADRIAAVIRQMAEEENVPMIENVPLARALYTGCAVEDYIPEELIEPVAEVLKWVHNLETIRREIAELDAVQL